MAPSGVIKQMIPDIFSRLRTRDGGKAFHLESLCCLPASMNRGEGRGELSRSGVSFRKVLSCRRLFTEQRGKRDHLFDPIPFDVSFTPE